MLWSVPAFSAICTVSGSFSPATASTVMTSSIPCALKLTFGIVISTSSAASVARSPEITSVLKSFFITLIPLYSCVTSPFANSYPSSTVRTTSSIASPGITRCTHLPEETDICSLSGIITFFATSASVPV